jgi:hypothetical protein
MGILMVYSDSKNKAIFIWFDFGLCGWLFEDVIIFEF